MTYLRVCCKKEWALEVMEQSELQAVCRIPNISKTYPRYFQIFPTYYLKDISKTYSWIIQKAEYMQDVFDWFLKVVSACWVLKIMVPPIFDFWKKISVYRKKKKFSKSALKRFFRHFQLQTVIQIRIVSSVSLLWKWVLRFKDFGPCVSTN